MKIPCLKTAFYKDGQQFFALLFSFGVPIDAEIVVISEITSNNPENEMTINNPENQFQNLSEESLVDNLEFTPDFAYNLGKMYALIISIIFVALISTTFGWTPSGMALAGIIIIILWFFLKIYTEPSPEIRRALIAGYGYGLFDVGAFMISPVCPGGTEMDLAVWLPLFTGLSNHFKNVFLPEYEEELGTEIAFVGFAIVNTFLWNSIVEKNKDRFVGWSIFFMFCHGIGLFLCFSIVYFPWIWGI